MLVEFEQTFNSLAAQNIGNVEEFQKLEKEIQNFIDHIKYYLDDIQSDFSPWLDHLTKCASFVNQIYLQMPEQFEIFLPMQVPYALHPRFHATQRSVQFTKPNSKYYADDRLFYGKAINAKHMNLAFQRDLKRVIKRLPLHQSDSNAVYELKYKPLCYNGVPFAHRIYGKAYGFKGRGISIDFILALEFDGAEVPLPAYFNAHISQKWLAYGRLPNAGNDNAYDWAVVLPRWHSKDGCVNYLNHNIMQLLHRALYTQKSFTFATPFFIKFGFAMTTMDIDNDYKRMSAADFFLTTLGHLVFRNFTELANDDNLDQVNWETLRQHQDIGKEIFIIMSKAKNANQISTELIEKFFAFNYQMDDILGESETDCSDTDNDDYSTVGLPEEYKEDVEELLRCLVADEGKIKKEKKVAEYKKEEVEDKSVHDADKDKKECDEVAYKEKREQLVEVELENGGVAGKSVDKADKNKP